MRRRVFIIVAALLALAGGGFLVVRAVPGLVRSEAQAWVSANLPGKRLTLGAIRFDLWALRLTIDDVAIGDAAAAPMLAAATVDIDASAASLWTLSARLDALRLVAPVVDAVVARDGTLNLAGLVPKTQSDDPLPTLAIRRLEVSDGRVNFSDRRGSARYAKRLAPIGFVLRDFTTAGDGHGLYHLAASGDSGERLVWDGKLALAPIASAGRFRLAGIRLADLAPLLGPALRPTAGTLAAEGGYALQLAPAAAGRAPPPQLTVDLARL
ncbi:hypothetical protein IP88_14670, partial [alpha proteobacterium AAP81b]